jgi:hypothetical protein
VLRKCRTTKSFYEDLKEHSVLIERASVRRERKMIPHTELLKEFCPNEIFDAS